MWQPSRPLRKNNKMHFLYKYDGDEGDPDPGVYAGDGGYDEGDPCVYAGDEG